MRYVCVTLVGYRKLYAKHLFFDYILKMNTPPREIWISATRELYDKFTDEYEGTIPLTWVHGEGDIGNQRIPSTTAAREALRQKILNSDYDWSLWLDNDMLVPPDMVEKFQILLRMRPDLLMVNAFHPGRKKSDVRHGLGSSFISKEMLGAYPFTMARLRGKDLGDDYFWKVLMREFVHIFNFPILSDFYFEMKHLADNGEIREFTEKDKKKLLR
jgi:hypothetical protein